jgi:hypothetical protein
MEPMCQNDALQIAPLPPHLLVRSSINKAPFAGREEKEASTKVCFSGHLWRSLRPSSYVLSYDFSV